MKFVDAFAKMLLKEKIYLPSFSESKYIYINEEGYIVNNMGYGISIDVNSDEWEVYEE